MTHASAIYSRLPALALPVLALLLATLWAPAAGAYDQYSVDRDETNCRACHGNDNPYLSPVDGISWGGTVHDVHIDLMVDGDCDTCHGASDFPVVLDSATGWEGFDPIGCMGCHGRDEDMGHDGTSLGRGAGLRQHHTNAGVPDCVECHDDADPGAYTPVAESVLPPFYSTPDAVHPSKPTDPCSPAGEEDFAGGPEGLDNDGDRHWDMGDPDCNPDVDGDGIPNDADGNPETLNPCSCEAPGVPEGCDTDCDDNCPFRANPDQLDRGGVDSPQYTPGDGSPDGVGDACQCGDMNADGAVDAVDLVLYRTRFGGNAGTPFSTDLCSVAGPTPADGACTIVDVVVMRRTFAGLGFGILDNACPAFLGLPDPGTP